MIVDNGEWSLGGIDDANIPMDIWLSNEQKRADDNGRKVDPDIGDAGGWKLTAANYCPRKGVAHSEAYEVYGTHEELVEIIRTKFMPLYQTALNVLEGICQGTKTHLYYWNNNNDDS